MWNQCRRSQGGRSAKGIADDLSSHERFTVNFVPKPFIRDRISSSSAVPFMETKRRQKYLACFQSISMRLSSGLYGGKWLYCVNQALPA